MMRNNKLLILPKMMMCYTVAVALLVVRELQPTNGFVSHHSHRNHHQPLIADTMIFGRSGSSRFPRGRQTSPIVRISASGNNSDVNGGSSSSSPSAPPPQSSTTSTKPLYDGTGYTFPDTTTSDGIAELIEVSFVNSCMELRTGHVDVLKCFIASCMAGYEFHFTIPQLLESLEIVEQTTQTANRPLMTEEVQLRTTWISLVYLTLSKIQHSLRGGKITKVQEREDKTTKSQSLFESIPESVRKDYETLVDQVATAYLNSIDNDIDTDDGTMGRILSMEELRSLDSTAASSLSSDAERAIRLQSIRIIPLTLQVRREAAEAAESDQQQPNPPTPPIEGAF